MISNLPRELLWTDKTDISEFMSDKLGNYVVSMNSYANSNITVALGAKIMLKLYNEAFYYSTRVVYEHNANAQPEAYMEEIISELGDKEMASYVMGLMFNVLLLQSDKSKEILQFIENLQKSYISNTPSRVMNWVNKIFKPRKNNASFRLNPSPCPADKLKGIDWNSITQGFSKRIIIDILELWDNDNEKGKVIRLIEIAYTSHQPELDEKETADTKFFEQYKNLYKVTKVNKIVNASKGGRPEGKSLNELFIETCTPAQRERLIEVVRKMKGHDAVYTLRVAALEDVGIIKKVPSYKKAKEYFPNIGASSGYYKYRDDKIKMDDNQIDYYKRLLIP